MTRPMSDHLSRILEGVREDLAHRKARRSMDELRRMEEIRGPAKELLSTIPRVPCVIAEIKRASPSRGWIRRDLDAVETARAYIQGGAWAVSVLTEERCFGGSLTDLAVVRHEFPGAVLLRKDFLLDEYMLAESRAFGADLVLLMVSVLGERTGEMVSLAAKHRLEPLVEVRDGKEMAIAAGSGARLIGINNRDLDTLAVDMSTAERLLPLVPEGAVAVVESGISDPAQVERYHRMGARLFLVGESLATSADPADTIRRYVGK
ncbi:MAG: indole-3-glycerol phosphate synthase TrpC [Thermodesulfobacteriota bacterium]